MQVYKCSSIFMFTDLFILDVELHVNHFMNSDFCICVTVCAITNSAEFNMCYPVDLVQTEHLKN